MIMIIIFTQQQRWQHNQEQRVLAGSCKSGSRFGTKKGEDDGDSDSEGDFGDGDCAGDGPVSRWTIWRWMW